MGNKLINFLRNFTIIFILVILAVGGGSMLYGEFTAILREDGIIETVTKGQTVEIDWKERYPFEEASEKAEEVKDKISAEDSAEGRSLDKLYEKYVSVVENLEYRVLESKNYIAGKTKLLELSGFLNRMIGKTDFSDTDSEVVQLKNGYLSNAQNFVTDDETMETSAGNIADFAEWLEKKDIPFLYVQTPSKNSKYDNQLPDGVEDHTNDNLDSLLVKLEEKGIDYLDFRDEMNKQGVDWYEMFYRTDHHWTVDCGLWAADTLAGYLNEEYSLHLDRNLVETEKYEPLVYEDWFLGFYGRKVTLGYTDPEDFVIEIPQFDTDLELINPDKGMDQRGTFESVMYNHDVFEKKDYYDNSCYESMLYGNRPVTQIINHKQENGCKVLFIRDSFSLAMAPYFSLMVSETDLLDLRDGFFDGSVRTYIRETKPDMVVLMTNAVCDRLK